MKNVFYIGLILLFISCESKVKYEKPEDLIPKDQMIDLLYDMHLANGTAGVKNKDLEKNKNYMTLVFEKYQIDSTRFASSNLYYISNINEYEDIFEEVTRRLDTLKSEYQRKRDSLKKELKKEKKIYTSKDIKLVDSLK
jgi:uncharacterized protein DUF4296